MVLCLVGGGENARANISPRSIVERLLLQFTLLLLYPRKISNKNNLPDTIKARHSGICPGVM